MAEQTTVVAVSLGIVGSCSVFFGTATLTFQEWAAHGNTTGSGVRPKEHTFDHTFFVQTWLFLAQFCCLGIFWVWKKIKGKPMHPEGEEQQPEERPRVRANVGQAARPNDPQRPRQDNDGNQPGDHGGRAREVVASAGQEDGHRSQGQAAAGGAAAGGAAAEDGVRRRRYQRDQRPRGRRPNANDQRKFNKIVFIPCMLCDFFRTGLLFVGMRQTYPSSFAMLRGVGLLSTCLLTIAFVGREKTVRKLQWVGAGISAAGLALVGLKDYVWRTDLTYDPYGIAAGDLLIVMAELMTVIKVLMEQRFVKKHDLHPLYAVGLEGMYGTVLMLLLLIPFYFVDVGAFNTLPGHRLEDPYDAFLQMTNEPKIAVAFVGSVLFFPLWYYCGIYVTKHFNAVTRMGVELNSHILSWFLYLSIGWQNYHYTQIPGFLVTVVGVAVFFFNADPITARFQAWRQRRRGGDGQPEQEVAEGEREPLLGNGNSGIQNDNAQQPQVNRPM